MGKNTIGGQRRYQKKVVNILSYDKVGRQMGNIGGPKGRGV